MCGFYTRSCGSLRANIGHWGSLRIIRGSLKTSLAIWRGFAQEDSRNRRNTGTQKNGSQGGVGM